MQQIEDGHMKAERRADRLDDLAQDLVKRHIGAQRGAETHDLFDLPGTALKVALRSTPLHPVCDHIVVVLSRLAASPPMCMVPRPVRRAAQHSISPPGAQMSSQGRQGVPPHTYD